MSEKSEKNVIIIGAAPEADVSYLKNLVDSLKNPYIICADGGLKSAIINNLVPDMIIGDMDSYDILNVRFKQSKIITLPCEKDYTDLKEAVDKALELGGTRLFLACVSGGRSDHFLANIHLLEYIAQKGSVGEILSKFDRIKFFENPRLKIMNEVHFKYFSIIPISEKLTNVNLSGLKYPLANAEISRIIPITVSNEVTEKNFSVSFDGKALLIFSRDSCDF